MRAYLALAIVVAGCASEPPPPTEVVGDFPTIEKTPTKETDPFRGVRPVVSPAPGHPYRVAVRFPDPDNPPLAFWLVGGGEPRMAPASMENGMAYIDPPIGVAPDRPLRLRLQRDERHKRDYPIKLPFKANPKAETLRPSDGGYVAELRPGPTESIALRLSPRPSGPVAFGAVATGRWDAVPDPDRPRRLVIPAPGSPLGLWLDPGLLRSGDRVKVVGEVVEGPTEDIVVRWREGRPRSVVAPFSDHEFDVSLAYPWKSGLEPPTFSVDPPFSLPGRLHFVLDRNGEFSEFGTDGRHSAMTRLGTDGRSVTATIRSMRVRKRTPVTFVLRVP